MKLILFHVWGTERLKGLLRFGQCGLQLRKCGKIVSEDTAIVPNKMEVGLALSGVMSGHGLRDSACQKPFPVLQNYT